MKMFSLLPVATLGLLAANTLFGAGACPIFTGGTAGGGGGVSATYTANSGGANGGCNVLIVFNADGSITTFASFHVGMGVNIATSYDNGGDDNMVGIINNTSHAINSVTLTGTQTPFGFDGDGACDPTWTFSGGNPCGTTTSGYGHQGVTFSAISSNFNTGTVNFAGGIAAGSSNWFSLEGPVDINLVVNGVPEPASVLLFGTLLAGVTYKLRRRQDRHVDSN
jgi:hypothetical protein